MNEGNVSLNSFLMSAVLNMLHVYMYIYIISARVTLCSIRCFLFEQVGKKKLQYGINI